MSYPVLTKGQKIVVNAGYHLFDAIVKEADDVLVTPEGHKEFLRRDCYAFEELDRLKSDVELYAYAVGVDVEKRKAQA
jgi:hypothetical protein